MITIDRNTSNIEQFNKVYKEYDWGPEQDQVDIFIKLLDQINTNNHIPSMIELGSGGTDASMYSVLFEKKFNYDCIIVNTEPRKWLLDNVRVAWKDMHLVNAKLYHGYTGEMKCYGCNPIDVSDVQKLTIKQLLDENNISNLDVLHADIQGSEVSICEELEKNDLFKNIKYFFISTHVSREGKSTYYDCLNFLNKNLNCKYHYSDPYKGGFGDGLIVAENIDYNQL